MRSRNALVLLAVLLLSASALPEHCQAQGTVFSGQGMEWGVEIGDRFEYTLLLLSSENMYGLSPTANAPLWGNVTYLPEIPDSFGALPTGTIVIYWPNATMAYLSLPVTPIGNWSTIRSFFEYFDAIGHQVDYSTSEAASTFSIMIGMSLGGIQYPITMNVTYVVSKSDGVPVRFLQTTTNETSGYPEVMIDIVRRGYDTWPPSMPLALGTVAIFIELAASILIVRRIISSRKSSRSITAMKPNGIST